MASGKTLEETAQKTIVFFDGVCSLCNYFVDWTVRRDPSSAIVFAPLQGTTAERVVPLEDRGSLSTVIALKNGKLHRRSSAVVTVLSELGFGWRVLARVLWLIPSPLRDLGYRLVARYRYRIFGKRETCRIPTPEERARFLD